MSASHSRLLDFHPCPSCFPVPRHKKLKRCPPFKRHPSFKGHQYGVTSPDGAAPAQSWGLWVPLCLPDQPHPGTPCLGPPLASLLLSFQPRGSTLPLLEGPQTDGVTIGDKGECVITPSTDLKFNPGLKGKNKLNYLRNYWLLIGKSWRRGPPRQAAASWWPVVDITIIILLVTVLSPALTVLSSRPSWSFRPWNILLPRKINSTDVLASQFSVII